MRTTLVAFVLKAVFLLSVSVSLFAHRATAAQDLPASSNFALDAMPPAGRWAARLELRTNGYDTWFDNNGRTRPLGAEYDNVELNATVFAPLALLGPGASMGTTRFDTRVDTNIVSLTMGYGVTDNLVLGFILPYARTTHQASFSVVGGNVGFNPAFDPTQPVGPANFPLAPSGGAIAPLGTEGVQTFLADPAYGYAYAPIRNTTTSGMGDPTVGGMWRFHKTGKDSAVLALGAHLGMAAKDDPDNLLDIPSGDGSTDLEARIEYFRDLGKGWDLRLLGRHREQLPDHVVARVPAPGALLATASSKERLARDLGDYQEYDIEIGRTWSDWRASLTWHRFEKASDRYSSGGTDTSALNANTEVYADQWRAGLSWSGIGAWRSGLLPLPLVAKLEMQNTYGGRNFPKLWDIYLQLTSFF